jgi:hypothetical protein
MITRRSAVLLPLASGAAVALSRMPPAHAQGAGGLQIIAADDTDDALTAVTDAIVAAGTEAGRVRAVPGGSIFQTVAHLANAAQPSTAVLASDVPAFLQSGSDLARPVPPLQSIARLYSADLHVAASQGIPSFADLSGRPVSLGPRGSQSHAVGSLLFARMRIPIEPVYLDPAAGIRAVLRREVAAVLALARRPSPLFFALNLADGIHFLPVPLRPGVLSGAAASAIQPEDYPMLSGGEAAVGSPVPTIGIPMVLAVCGWSPESDPYRVLAQWTNALFQRASRLRGFDPAADVPGWARFPPAAVKLGRVAPRALAQDTAPRPPPKSAVVPPTAAAPRDNTVRRDDRDQLFQEFLRWSRSQ